VRIAYSNMDIGHRSCMRVCMQEALKPSDETDHGDDRSHQKRAISQ